MQRLFFMLILILGLCPSTFGHKATLYYGQAATDSSERLLLMLHSSPQSIYITVATNCTYRRGDFLHIRGHAETNEQGIAKKIVADHIRITGHKNLPEAKSVKGHEINDPALLYQLVRLRGHLETAFIDDVDDRTSLFIIKTGSGNVPSAFSVSEHPLEELRALINSEVEIEGFILPTSGYRNDLQRILIPRNPKSMTVITPSPDDPFSAPELTSAAITCRQRTDGVVLAVGKDKFYLRTPTHRYLPVKPSDKTHLPQIGDVVTVVGFAENEAFNLQLLEAEFKVNPQPTSPLPPVDVEIKDIDSLFRLSNGHREVSPCNGDIIRCRGLVITSPGENETDFRRFKLQTANFSADIDLSGLAAFAAPEIGTAVEITGIAVAEYENATPGTALPRFKKLTLLPRTPDDIRILKDTPWWTPARLQGVIAALLCALIGSLLWVRSLRALSEKRGRELLQENADKLSETLRVAERTRLAVELHDSISQNLTGVAMELEAAERSSTESSVALVGHLNSAASALRSCRSELRNCIWDLKSNALEEPTIEAAIRKTLVPYLKGVNLSIHFAVPRELLTDNTCHSFLSIIRELTVNGIRHGRASVIKIAGTIENGQLLFSVTDNGCGFDPKVAPGISEGHFGLEGISERLSAFGGTLTLRSAPGKGCKAVISINLPQTNQTK